MVQFVCWLDKSKQKPTIVVDGANIAFYGQNTAEGGFKFRQIMYAVVQIVGAQVCVRIHYTLLYCLACRQMVKQLRRSYPENKVLVVLHIGRVRMLSVREWDIVNCIGSGARGNWYSCWWVTLQAQPQEVQDFFNGLHDAGSFAVAPLGSNDDW